MPAKPDAEFAIAADGARGLAFAPQGARQVGGSVAESLGGLP